MLGDPSGGLDGEKAERCSIFLKLSNIGMRPGSPRARQALESAGFSSFLQKGFPRLGLLAATVALFAPHVIVFLRTSNLEYRHELFWAALSAVAAGLMAKNLIPRMKRYTEKSGLQGKDLCKRGTTEGDKPVPEALGIVCGCVFLVIVILAQLFWAKNNSELLGEYNAALMSVCFMVLLGFADDLMDLPWRYKLILPTVASLPLLVTYDGPTSVLMPSPIRPLMLLLGQTSRISGLLQVLGIEIDLASAGAVVSLGVWYLAYMGFLAVFCTNAINIYAGVNGLEAGQTLIIALAVLFTNIFELATGYSGSEVVEQHHLFSATLILPFIAVTLALLYYNWYPAEVFVGDTFCYFAGMTFAVVGILGHFSKTLLLFFIPQILNFLYSCPQLFKVYPCPRHRLPV
eukprot:gb/GECG01001825.1/.p1 GENE.gb/GECG01001825.1/~~gb/GECG01001825.1/.p1  ORF type:complete len:402 (+),score=16.13 gb/GECG01001825.1/:1-1206(+)